MKKNLYNFAHKTQCKALVNALEDEGFSLVVLDGSNLENEDDFFKEISTSSLQPVGMGAKSSGALEDNLWSGIPLLSDKVAIVWNDSDSLMNKDIRAFVSAVDVLISVGRSLYDPSLTSRVGLVIFFVGNTDGYFNSSIV